MAKKSAHGEIAVQWTKTDKVDGKDCKRTVALFHDGKILTKRTSYTEAGKVDQAGEWKLGHEKMQFTALMRKGGITVEQHAVAVSKCKAMAGYTIDMKASDEAFVRRMVDLAGAAPVNPSPAPEAKGNGSKVKDEKAPAAAPEVAPETPKGPPAAPTSGLVPCRGTCPVCETSIKGPSQTGVIVPCGTPKCKGKITMKALAAMTKSDREKGETKGATPPAPPVVPPAPPAEEPPAPVWAPPSGAWSVGDLLRALGVHRVDPLADRTRLTVGIDEDLSEVFGVSTGQIEGADGTMFAALTIDGKLKGPNAKAATPTETVLPLPLVVPPKGKAGAKDKGKGEK
jgi:hypothetical protein